MEKLIKRASHTRSDVLSELGTHATTWRTITIKKILFPWDDIYLYPPSTTVSSVFLSFVDCHVLNILLIVNSSLCDRPLPCCRLHLNFPLLTNRGHISTSSKETTSITAHLPPVFRTIWGHLLHRFIWDHSQLRPFRIYTSQSLCRFPASPAPNRSKFVLSLCFPVSLSLFLFTIVFRHPRLAGLRLQKADASCRSDWPLLLSSYPVVPYRPRTS